MSMLSNLALVFAAISFYIGVYHLLIFLRRRENKSNLLFSLSCFSIFLYNLACIGLYGVSTPVQGAYYQRFQIIFIGCFSLSLYWFIAFQLSDRYKKMDIIISGLAVFFILFQILDRSSLTWKLDFAHIKSFTIPLLKIQIKYIEVAQGIISDLGGIFILLSYSYMLFLCIKAYKKKRDKKLFQIIIALSIFFISVIEDVLVSSGVYSFIYLLEFGFIGFILVITNMLSGEIIAASVIREALEKSEKRLSKIVSGSPLAILVADRMEKVELVNAKFVEIFGYRHRDIPVLNKWWSIAYPDETYRKKVIQEWHSFTSIDKLDDVNIPVIHHSIKRKDGAIGEFELMLGIFEDIILVIFHDITERKAAEKKLSITTNTLDTAQKIAHLGSTFWDISTGEVNWSDELFRIFGLNPEDFKHNFQYVYQDIITNCVHPDDREAVRVSLERVMKEGISIPVEYRIIRADGSLRYVHADRKLFSDENGKAKYLIGYVQDITERKKVEMEKEKLIEELQITLQNEQSMKEELESAYEEANYTNEQLEKSHAELETANQQLEEALRKAEELSKMKSEFLAIVSHELRTPLTGILGFSQLLSIDNELNENQKEYATRIYKLSDKLQGVLNDLIEISLIESGIVKIEYSNFPLEEIVDDIYILFKDTLESKKIRFVKELENTPVINTDPARLRQILLNIIGNAVKFTETGTITVKFHSEKGYYHFAVSDTGIGIDSENSEKIFEMFKQIESPKSRRYGGMGLGLAVCKKLVEALQGNIRVESEVNKGSTFYFDIPVASENAISQDSD